MKKCKTTKAHLLALGLASILCVVNGSTLADENAHDGENEGQKAQETSTKHTDHDHTIMREHGAHVHGKGQLTLAIDDNEIAITLTTPAESLLGFEHTPTTEQEKSRLQQVLAQLNAPEKLFDFGAAAHCKKTASTVESPFIENTTSKTGDAPLEHADIDAEYQFNCEHPEKITVIVFPLLSSFPHLKSLNVEYVTSRAQGSQNLSADNPELSLR